MGTTKINKRMNLEGFDNEKREKREELMEAYRLQRKTSTEKRLEKLKEEYSREMRKVRFGSKKLKHIFEE